MDYTIILGYIGLLVMQLIALQSLPITLIGGILSNIIGRNSAFLFAGIVTWLGISYLWFKIFGYPLPLLAFILSIVFQFLHANKEQNALNEVASKILIAEIWSIIIVALYVLIFVEFNWY